MKAFECCNILTAGRLALAAAATGLLFSLLQGDTMRAEEPAEVYPMAVLQFEDRGAGAKGYGEKVGDILFASLASDANLYLVERPEMEKIFKEHKLNLSGMVAPDQATQMGRLTGAKIIVTGSAIEAGNSIYIVAKIVGTETGRVLGQSVKGRSDGDLATLAEELAGKVAETVQQRAGQLVAKPIKRENRIKTLAETLGNVDRPKVFIRIEERHVGQPAIDPAAETELTLCCKETGFEVVDPAAGSADQADIKISGEGFSEFAARHGDLVSVKARLEVKAVDRRTGMLLAADRQTAIKVDLSEQLAGKNALQEAALQIAERLLPKAVERWNETKNEGKDAQP